LVEEISVSKHPTPRLDQLRALREAKFARNMQSQRGEEKPAPAKRAPAMTEATVPVAPAASAPAAPAASAEKAAAKKQKAAAKPAAKKKAGKEARKPAKKTARKKAG
jgi:hypothetical protein